MARGITESDVHAAADALVAAGARPTVERIRAHLGTGSPNTVIRWLETWWQTLDSRLQAHSRRASVPDVPDAVAAIASEWWGIALEHAGACAQDGLAGERAALSKARDELQKARDTLADEASALERDLAAAVQAESLAVARSVELERLVRQLEGQVEEMHGQREAAVQRASASEADRQAATARVHALEDAFRLEREEMAQHVKGVEDRAGAEIDRARQESKALSAQIASNLEAHASRERSMLAALENATVKTAEAQQAAAVHCARAAALQDQLEKLKDLPAAMAALLRKGKVTAKPRSSATTGAAAKRKGPTRR